MYIFRIFNSTKILRFSKAFQTHTFTFSNIASKEILKPRQARINVRNFSTEINHSNKLVGKWLLGVSGMVSVAVVLGGVTRLTESGLSMVTWKLLGEKVPANQEQWEAEFEKYKQFPEYKLKNQNMTVNEFKFIYMMEYIHRMWGRAIGVAFFVPSTFFLLRGYLCKNNKIRVGIMGTLLAAQGIMGWYMVKSGLEDKFENVNDVPRVSQYRLASHLALAFVLYALSLSSALANLLPAEKISIVSQRAIRFRYFAHFAKALIFFTAVSGAFVAGLDAGLVYNSFPKMGDKWIPDDIVALNPVYKNFTENPTTVQFDHRILGISTLSLVSMLWLMSRRVKLPKRSYWAMNAVAVAAWTQVVLGVTTLLNYVPVPLATAHQSGSLVLLSLVMWLTHEVRFIKYIPK